MMKRRVFGEKLCGSAIAAALASPGTASAPTAPRQNTLMHVDDDPAQLEGYGYASWTPRKGIVMLRNPDDKPREFALDVGAGFELPEGAAKKYSLRSPWAEDAVKPALSAEAGEPLRVTLKPFEVVVLEAILSANSSTKSVAASAHTALIPKPVRLNAQPGTFNLAKDTRVIATGKATAEATNLAVWLRSATQRMPVSKSEKDSLGAVRFFNVATP